jgi:hypothetical protein
MIDANCRLIADKVETLLKVLDTQKRLQEHYKRDFSLDEVFISFYVMLYTSHNHSPVCV